jgi:hypothetical protein
MPISAHRAVGADGHPGKLGEDPVSSPNQRSTRLTQELVASIRTSTEDWNENPRPFV